MTNSWEVMVFRRAGMMILMVVIMVCIPMLNAWSLIFVQFLVVVVLVLRVFSWWNMFPVPCLWVLHVLSGVFTTVEGKYFNVVLQKGSPAESIGIDVDPFMDGQMLRITGIKDGSLIKQWNTSNPTKKVKVMDMVVAVNGMGGSVDVMADEIKKNTAIVLRILRGPGHGGS
ncbi:unnamed protein product [Prorocentrum cordatum]|uniref:PDZ domain-containing protein n=1 Tax=Prorocentrum cordatum TaxID=2364126 RepID=A0ABN9UXB1_9DINO|nr:unnamed protein product [Polarella glacialis]